MQTIEFTPEEIEVLREVLQKRSNDIDVEIFRTDTHDYKELLRHRHEILEFVLKKLNAAAVPA